MLIRETVHHGQYRNVREYVADDLESFRAEFVQCPYRPKHDKADDVWADLLGMGKGEHGWVRYEMLHGAFGIATPSPVIAEQTSRRTRVLVPGEMIAYYEDGKIRRWVFVPSEADAGYFGPGTTVLSGDPLNVEDQDGPFWDAVRETFTYAPDNGPCSFTAEWEV